MTVVQSKQYGSDHLTWTPSKTLRRLYSTIVIGPAIAENTETVISRNSTQTALGVLKSPLNKHCALLQPPIFHITTLNGAIVQLFEEKQKENVTSTCRHYWGNLSPHTRSTSTVVNTLQKLENDPILKPYFIKDDITCFDLVQDNRVENKYFLVLTWPSRWAKYIRIVHFVIQVKYVKLPNNAPIRNLKALPCSPGFSLQDKLVRTTVNPPHHALCFTQSHGFISDH